MGDGRRKNGAKPRDLRAERLDIFLTCDLGENFIGSFSEADAGNHSIADCLRSALWRGLQGQSTTIRMTINPIVTFDPVKRVLSFTQEPPSARQDHVSEV